MDKNKALVAMSGGVDSSVAAHMAKTQGFECIGITMKFFDNEDIMADPLDSCCSAADIEDARNVARLLGMPLYAINMSSLFKERVISKFVKGYKQGETPNPCIDCNRYVKFHKMYSLGDQLGVYHVITGHYARVEYDALSRLYVLKKAMNAEKDQSYVLYGLDQEQLARTIFPLGEYTKTQIRSIASDLGFANASKPDSQDICFIKNGDYGSFIDEYSEDAQQTGFFVDMDGNILGPHKGLSKYTIGQRKGLGLSMQKPMYVHSINTADNTVVLCENHELYRRDLRAGDFHWISGITPTNPFRAEAKIRYAHTPAPATVVDIEGSCVGILFDEPQRAITKGQAVVLYDGDVILGGGTIIDY